MKKEISSITKLETASATSAALGLEEMEILLKRWMIYFGLGPTRLVEVD
jgi:hypothetical protein